MNRTEADVFADQAVQYIPRLRRYARALTGDAAAADRAATEVGIDHLTARPVHTLSGGQLQRAFIARGLAQVAAGAGLLLVDEPTSALDFGGRDLVADLLGRTSVTLVVVTHDRHLADSVDRRYEMAAGQLRLLSDGDAA